MSTVKPQSNLSEGILCLLKPAVEEIDLSVKDTRESQLLLRDTIDKLTIELEQLASLHKPPLDLDPYIRKLFNCRRKITVVNSVLQNTQERLNKLQQNISRETNKKKILTENITF
uniref:Biogenesis of lysosome-related organelles complex 1 subunit 7 n=1 Tax=Hydra vulgaris TaxID=6087 RepID=T2MHS0_HYDVU